MQNLKIAFVGLLSIVALSGVMCVDVEQPAQYEFNYAVNDPLTGDQKDQQESRSGDAVVGYYRTVDADGLVRTVKYQADEVNGFQAEVVREPVAGGVAVVAKAAAPVKPAAVVPAAPAVAPAVAPASYYYGSYPYAGYQPYSAYGYQPYSAYGYQPYAAYGYQPYSAYGYQPYAAYGYQPYSYPYASSKYAPLTVARK